MVTLDASKPTVGEAKAEIARTQGTAAGCQELYRVAERADGLAVREDDAEPELLDDESVELGDGDVVAMAVEVSGYNSAAIIDMQYDDTIIGFLSETVVCCLTHQEPPLLWRTFPAGRVTLSEGGAVATHTATASLSLTTTGAEITEGKHYWEVELLLERLDMMFIGISRPNLDPTEAYWLRECTDGWFIRAATGGLYGNGKDDHDKAGAYKQGDRVGVLLDLENSSLRFFKNGVQHGPGYPAGSVTGPVVAAVQMWYKDNSVRMLPNAEAPPNA
jgi:hypothetical protein